uniref:Uncharacterized protein n=1 Tax=Rhizophora mucronata TaxID=61149 RepID=A0A2P2MX18_RHIMU
MDRFHCQASFQGRALFPLHHQIDQPILLCSSTFSILFLS